MAKTKKAFFCQNCGAESPKWIGKCPACGEWNTYVEEVVAQTPTSGNVPLSKPGEARQARRLDEIQADQQVRKAVPDAELNRVLGGGLVPGSLVLLGGEPGIGKSTLLLQVALRWKKTRVLYVSGEESEQQIRMRAERIGMGDSDCYLLSETALDQVMSNIERVQPEVIIIDSIQTLFDSTLDAAAGSISQIRTCTGRLLQYAKTTHTPVWVIGHINKEGQIAGPKVLEHMVDAVLQFEGDRNYMYRILRAAKNRFGSTHELGIYRMEAEGLKEVSNPSEIFVGNRESPLSGTAIAATLEGLRPMLIETQALVSSAVYGTPQRSATGFDLRRLSMLLAVLEKRCGFKLGLKDVFLNMAGGIRVDDPAIDLAVVAAILSSYEDVPIQSNVAFAAEVGLTGEVRPVTRIEQRIREAEKLGLERMYVSRYNFGKGKSIPSFNLEVVPISNVIELFRDLF